MMIKVNNEDSSIRQLRLGALQVSREDLIRGSRVGLSSQATNT